MRVAVVLEFAKRLWNLSSNSTQSDQSICQQILSLSKVGEPEHHIRWWWRWRWSGGDWLSHFALATVKWYRLRIREMVSMNWSRSMMQKIWPCADNWRWGSWVDGMFSMRQATLYGRVESWCRTTHHEAFHVACDLKDSQDRVTRNSAPSQASNHTQTTNTLPDLRSINKTERSTTISANRIIPIVSTGTRSPRICYKTWLTPAMNFMLGHLEALIESR